MSDRRSYQLAHDHDAAISTLEKSIQSDEARLEKSKENAENLQAEMDEVSCFERMLPGVVICYVQLTVDMREKQDQQKELKQQEDDLDVTIKEHKKAVKAKAKQLEKTQKVCSDLRPLLCASLLGLLQVITSAEATMEQLRNKRHGIFQSCTVSEIKIPLSDGGMLTDADVLAASSQAQG